MLTRCGRDAESVRIGLRLSLDAERRSFAVSHLKRAELCIMTLNSFVVNSLKATRRPSVSLRFELSRPLSIEKFNLLNVTICQMFFSREFFFLSFFLGGNFSLESLLNK